MSYLDWYAGMKVICVATMKQLAVGYGDEVLPVVGETYTVRAIGPCDVSGTMAVLLVEIVNKVRVYALPNGVTVTGEPGFAASLFRPVQSRATDISIFTSMLTPRREVEPA